VTLNTRSKILPISRADEFAGALFVAMYLDPLTAAHARRLEELAATGRKVVVLLSDPPDPLLPLAARAELAASLASVSAVMLVDVVSEHAADLERRDSLTRHVLGRHASAG